MTPIQPQGTSWLLEIIKDFEGILHATLDAWPLILPGVVALFVTYFQNRQSRGRSAEMLNLRDRLSKLEQRFENLHDGRQ